MCIPNLFIITLFTLTAAYTPKEPTASILTNECPSRFRQTTGRCTNSREDWLGKPPSPQYSYFENLSSDFAIGTARKSAREISNLVGRQDRTIVSEIGLNVLARALVAFIDHDTYLLRSNTSEPFDIPLSANDSFAPLETIPFFRSEKSGRLGVLRPANQVTAAFDLSSLYGTNKTRATYLRTFRGGTLLQSSGALLPFNFPGFPNRPFPAPAFFLSGDERVNEHPVQASVYTLFLREHNRLADELAVRFTHWSDYKLFNFARLINVAQWQAILTKELVPAIIGENLKPYDGYREDENPELSIEFSAVALPSFHSAVAATLRKISNTGDVQDVPFLNVSYMPPTDILQSGIEPWLKGAMSQYAERIDLLHDNVIRNARLPGLVPIIVDLISFLLQRGRDIGLFRYNVLRERFGLSRANTFYDISNDSDTVKRMASAYKNADSVEAYVGALAEPHQPNSAVGPLLKRIWKTEFERLRSADRLWYEREGVLPAWMDSVESVHALKSGSFGLRQLLLRNTLLQDSDIPARVLFV